MIPPLKYPDSTTAISDETNFVLTGGVEECRVAHSTGMTIYASAAACSSYWDGVEPRNRREYRAEAARKRRKQRKGSR